jgi:RNA polymerase sigma factor (sigma-70 family)
VRSKGGLFRPFLVGGAKSAAAVATRSPDHAARFRELMLPHLDAAYNFARWLATDPVAAEDVVQEAFLRAFRGIDGFNGGSPRAWLFAIVRNCWRDRASTDRDRGRILVSHANLSEAQAAAIDNIPDDGETAETSLIRDQEIAALRETIAQIPEPFREALVLREMEGLSYRDIAAVTGVPIGTVMSRLARAREILAKLLIPEDGVASATRGEERA